MHHTYVSEKFPKQEDIEFAFKGALIKPTLVEPIKALLQKHNVVFHNWMFSNYQNTGFYILNGTIHMCAGYKTLVPLQHELAHLVRIKNLDRLLVKNWGMPFAARKDITPKFKKQSFFSEAKVWGVEQFLSGATRIVNEHWASLYCQKDSQEYKDDMAKAQALFDDVQTKLTDEKIMSELEIKFNFIQNKINENPNFTSRNFNWWDSDD